MTLEELRAQFPSTQNGVHLNHAGMGPTPTAVSTAVSQALIELGHGDGMGAFRAHLTRQERLRERLARMMNVEAAGVGLVRNTSHGLAIAAQAIPFLPGENVVVGACEYPSVVYPWQAQAVRGVETRIVACLPPHDLLSEDALIAACDAKTRVLAVSWVQWGTGQRMDLTKLGAFCKARNIWFVVDVIQGLGALECDLSACGADIAAGGCHKWLLAPAGIGPLYIKPERLSELLPTNVGWNWVNNPFVWDRLRFEDARPRADRFEEGSPAILATAALDASLALLEAVGMAEIERAVRHHAQALRTRLRALGLEVCPTDGHSGIVPFRHPTKSNEEILAVLEQENIWAAVRCGWVRFSPHAYTNDDDLERAIGGLRA
ncbi:aminotransferase class V-fold PLP-dependent enzyme [Armatimonas sp.]|uniref:aminotransferase class V-fold PLP-dependent enzyme n=1 Tax=Armatimonas sp. TaxID=1872638 RepID=UPI00286CF9F6|nr:aminotransferase class V-fold PLP-dependent enzyme [Armatimonas sp.]